MATDLEWPRLERKEVMMSGRWQLGLLWAISLAWCVPAHATHLVKVTGHNVNLRAKPSLSAEVVSQADEGDILIARSFKQDWVEVIPEDRVDFWVHSDFVSDGQVTATKLNVRAGAGINYSTVCVLKRGDTIAVRGEFGEWLKIAPPLDASLWISAKLVELLRTDKKGDKPVKPWVGPKPPVPEVVAPVASAVSTSAPPDQPGTEASRGPSQDRGASSASSRQKLVPLEGQGETIQVRGTLRRVGFLRRGPAKFRLVEESRYRSHSLCYVRGNMEQLDSFVGTTMTIKGRQYWLQGSKYPVVVPEQIIPHSGP